MRIFWLCPLVHHPLRANVWMPAIAPVRDEATGNFPCEWSSTDFIRGTPYALGSAEVTSAQLDAIEAHVPNIHAIEEAEWMTQFRNLSGTRRTRFNNFFTSIGEVRPGTNEVPRDFMQRISQIIDGKTVDMHLERLAEKMTT